VNIFDSARIVLSSRGICAYARFLVSGKVSCLNLLIPPALMCDIQAL
jgi:hypothetical protein